MNYTHEIARKITPAEYALLSPYAQGYASYWQGAWNKQIPDKNPFAEASNNHAEWNRGNMAACLNAQDSEE